MRGGAVDGKCTVSIVVGDVSRRLTAVVSIEQSLTRDSDAVECHADAVARRRQWQQRSMMYGR